MLLEALDRREAPAGELLFEDVPVVGDQLDGACQLGVLLVQLRLLDNGLEELGGLGRVYDEVLLVKGLAAFSLGEAAVAGYLQILVLDADFEELLEHGVRRRRLDDALFMTDALHSAFCA